MREKPPCSGQGPPAPSHQASPPLGSAQEDERFLQAPAAGGHSGTADFRNTGTPRSSKTRLILSKFPTDGPTVTLRWPRNKRVRGIGRDERRQSGPPSGGTRLPQATSPARRQPSDRRAGPVAQGRVHGPQPRRLPCLKTTPGKARHGVSPSEATEARGPAADRGHGGVRGGSEEVLHPGAAGGGTPPAMRSGPPAQNGAPAGAGPGPRFGPADPDDVPLESEAEPRPPRRGHAPRAPPPPLPRHRSPIRSPASSLRVRNRPHFANQGDRDVKNHLLKWSLICI